MKKDILTLLDLEKRDFDGLFKRAVEMKIQKNYQAVLAGKTLGLLFEKASTRTRLSFETAAVQLGAVPIFISSKDTQMARSEPIKDTARVMSRYLDFLAIRTYSQEIVEEFAKYTDIPVINALTDLYHPCQVLSDIMTVIEAKGSYENLKIVWAGDGNNVAHSWINAAAVLGLNLLIACPKGYEPDADILARAKAKNCGHITITSDAMEAAKDADVIYTDVWASMGQEDLLEERKKIFMPYQVNSQLMAQAKNDVIVMHCLPAHRGEEITEEVLEGPNSVVWDQAENKMHMHRAILEMLMA